MSFYRFYLFLICSFLSLAHVVLPMEQDVAEITKSVRQIRLKVSRYDSDSEDEKGYTYRGLPALTIPENKRGKKCVVLSRGIHFSPSTFDRRKRSQMRKANDAGKDIFCSAAYDLAEQPLDSNDTKKVKEKAIEIRDQITQMPEDDRNTFQQIYSNNYDGFHNRLGTDSDDGIFEEFESNKNPQVSTSEDFIHPGKYASGHKFLGKDIESLDPDYDQSGKPKHPYLGKLFAILISEAQIAEFDPYFVVYGHANDYVTISSHFSKNVLSEREVSFAGLIPGDCVALSIPLRVPSFKGEYKSWYEEKFGISKSSYLRRQKLIKDGNQDTVKSLLMDVILPHMAEKMKAHIESQCAAQQIRLVHKQLGGSFGQTLPALANATDYKKRIKQRKKDQED